MHRDFAGGEIHDERAGLPQILEGYLPALSERLQDEFEQKGTGWEKE